MKRFVAVKLLIVVLNTFSASFAKNDGGDDVCWRVFDISNRTIIKSTASLNSGAKYLKSIRLRTRDECMTACCNTEGCNLAVLQEKADGDCYLFDCGTLSDFKCTFGVHDDHVAMGMMVNRQDIEKTKVHEQAKHEMDLNLLKTQQDILVDQKQRQRNQDSGNAPAVPEPEPAATVASVQQNYFQNEKVNNRKKDQQVLRSNSASQDDSSSDVANSADDYSSNSKSNERNALKKPKQILSKNVDKPVRPFNNQMQQSMKSSKSVCGIQQWQCETSDQCLAVYDRCDGIAQCKDGSDEKNCDSALSNGRKSNVPVQQQNPPPMYGQYYPADNPPQQAVNDLTNGDQANKNQNGQSWNDFQNYDNNGNQNYQSNQRQQKPDGRLQYQQQKLPNLNPNLSNNRQQQQNQEIPNKQQQNNIPKTNGNIAKQQQPALQKPTGSSGQDVDVHEKESSAQTKVAVSVEHLDYGRSSTSLAAVMLGLGLAVLALLLLFISCRLRRARRRLRRGKVLDADEGEYLINGLYL